MAAPELLNVMLKEVSRSFYLTLRVLPTAIRPQIGLAYLLARTTDTIADTEIVPVADRLRALEDLRGRILGQSTRRLDVDRFAAAANGSESDTTPAERLLLARIEEVLDVLSQFTSDDQRRIRDVLTTITSGQAMDLQRFGHIKPGDSPAQVVALPSDAELDDYTFRVAGCVGEFWTRMCRAHLFPAAAWDEALMLGNGVRFGKGLQLVNILRDLPADLRKGRCYIPLANLRMVNLEPADLLRTECEPKFRPVYVALLDRAEGHLAAGWDYTNALPRGLTRVRLACAWPILIGLRTLRRLRLGQVLDPAHRIKASRREVWGIILRSTLLLPFPSAWRRQPSSL